MKIEAVGDIDSRDLPLGDKQCLHVAVKSADGKLFVDARKWYKWANLDTYIPSRKGLQLSKEDWKLALPVIHALVDT